MPRSKRGRRKTIFLTQNKKCASRLADAYERLETWKAVGDEFGISGGMAYRVAVLGYEPHKPAIRSALGLPARVEVVVCAKCGQPPLARHHRCAGSAPKPRKPRRNWRGLALVLAGVVVNRR